MTRRSGSLWILLFIALSTHVAPHLLDARPGAIPSLVGQWKVVGGTSATYENVLDVNSTPEFATGVPTDVLIVITGQKAGAFAGYLTEGGDKTLLLTGVIASDNSVSMRFAGGNSRTLITGKYSVSGKKKQIKGTYFNYEEFTASVPGMSNGFMELEKK